MPLSRFDGSSSDSATTGMTPTSSGFPSSSPATDDNDGDSTASESEIDSSHGDEMDDSKDDNDKDDDDVYSKKRHRHLPPPIFFGTPKQEEHEKRKRYAAQLRTRRLLRKDSLELTRRKGVGLERSNESKDHFEACSIGLHALHADEDDISALALSDLSCTSEGVDEVRKHETTSGESFLSDSEIEDDSSSEELSAGGNSLAGDRTIRIRDALKEVQIEDADEMQPPSTPTKQIIRPYISRSSLALSDADSSPGTALAEQHSSTCRPSPFFRPSPASGSQAKHTVSPLVTNSSIVNHFDISCGDLELGKEYRTPHSTSPRKNVLKESPSKMNQALSMSPFKTSQSSSPTKVVVRQTLSAWAHAKLKTPQSPEKKEWDRRRAEVASPSRQPQVSPEKMESLSEKMAEKSFGIAAEVKPPLAHSSQKGIITNIHRPHSSSTGSGSIEGLDQFHRPASRIARPVPASRLPKPVPKPAQTLATRPAANMNTTASVAAKRMIISGAAPTFRRIVNTSTSTSSFRTSSATSVSSIRPVSRPPILSISSSVSLRPQIKVSREFQGTSFARPIVSTSSSPSKIGTSATLQRSTLQTSPPAKRLIASSNPVVRDARLFSGSRCVQEMMLDQPASSASSSSSLSPVIATVSLPQNSETLSAVGTSTQASAGVGGARRVAISQEIVRLNHEPQVQKRTHKVERPHNEERGVRIKEIMMGKISSSDGSDVPTSSTPTVSEEVAIPVIPSQTSQETNVTVVDTLRSSKRQQGKGSNAKTSKPSKSISIFPSSVANGPLNAETMPMSKLELSRLTSQHTQRNELFVSQVETIVVRKKGENRPASPSSKIRKNIATTVSIEAAKEARMQRARRRTPDLIQGEETEQSSLSLASQHLLGAGEDEIFTSPLRSPQRHHRVRWHKSLYCGPNQLQPGKTSSAAKIKGCLRNQSIPLDSLGNVYHANQPLSPRITRNKVIVYKLIYDDDEQ